MPSSGYNLDAPANNNKARRKSLAKGPLRLSAPKLVVDGSMCTCMHSSPVLKLLCAAAAGLLGLAWLSSQRSLVSVPPSKSAALLNEVPTAIQATAVSVVKTLPPSKKFVYLIQAPGNWDDTRLKTNEDRDVLWLSYTTMPTNRTDMMYMPGTSWSEGRNALLDFALQRAAGSAGLGYEYYTFLDRDALEMVNGEDPWGAWEANLMSEQPAVGYLVDMFPWQIQMSHSLPGEKCVRSLFNVDAAIQGFHRTTLGLALPYDTSLDAKSIFFSAYISNMEVAAFYPHSRVGFYDITSDREKQEHLNPKGSLSYIRSTKWNVCKQYMAGAFLDATALAAIDVANCHTISDDRYCERQACPGVFNRTGPANLSWMKEHTNVNHSWAASKIAFLQKWDGFLNRGRTSFVREPDDCSGRSPSSARCLS